MDDTERLAERLKSSDAVMRMTRIDGFDIDRLLGVIKDEEKKRFLHYKPYSKQLEFHNSMADERIISGGNQSGKSQPLDENVLTPDGWVCMGSLKVNDYVVGSDGLPKRVTGVFPQGERDVYSVEFFNGVKVRCDTEHLWTITRPRKETLTAKEIKALVDSGEKVIVQQAREVSFNVKGVSVEPYLLGLLLGDGCLRTTEDKELVDYISDTVKRYDCQLIHLNKFDYKVSSLVNGHNLLMDKLRLYSKDKHIPDEYKFNSRHVRLEVLRGLIDTDGTVNKDGSVVFYSVSKRLCEDVYDVAMSLGIRASVKIKNGKYKGWRVNLGVSKYEISKLKRKKDRLKLKEPERHGFGIKKIELCEKTQCQCIMVDAEDHLYITSGFMLTHNTVCGSMETCFHLTGRYPEWWKGHRIEPRINASTGEKEITIWVIGTDTKTVRDSLQSKIIGTEAKEFTDGCLHPDLIDRKGIIKSRGVTGLVDTVYVKHISGCMCKLQFRSYEQGRENLQSATVDACYCDEEPPSDIIGEIRARLGATGGFLYIAFTPLKGMTPLVQEFWNRDNPDKFLVCMSIYEANHYTPERLRKIESKYAGLSEAERQARMNGIPTMGSGVVYPIDDKDLYWDYVGEIPQTWERIGGLDFGRGDHPTALTWLARDPVTDIVYLYDALKVTRNSIAENASLIRKRGAWIPFAYPHDLMRDSGVTVSRDKLKQTEGYRYKQMYEDEGVTLTPTNAKTVDGSTRVEVGIVELRQRMLQGRFKVAKHLSEWFKEKQVYRYGEDGKPIKEKDDLLDSTRYAIIMLRYAISERDMLLNIGTNRNGVVDNTEVY